MPNRTASRKRRISNVWTIWALVIVLAWGASIFATVASAADPKTPLLKLTEEEKAWLAAHKTIRLGVDPSYPPFEFIGDDGAYAGLASEYARLVGERLGITLKMVPGLSWSQVLAGVKGGTVDVLPAATKTPERNEFMNFSRVRLDFPDVIMMRDGHSLVAGLADMRGRKVALVDGYSTVEAISAKYPTIQIILTDSPLHALKSVAEGEAEATVQNLGVATYLIKEHDLTNLNVAAPADLDQPGLSFGVRKDWPELVPLINKVLASITPAEEAAIREKWGSTQYQIGINTATVRQVALQVGGAGAIIVIVIVLWNRRLSREVKQRKRAEEDLAEKEAQLRLALDNMPGCMTLESRDRNYVLVNSKYSELHDYPEGFLTAGMSVRDEVRYQAERGDYGPGNRDELVEQVLDLYQGENAASWERTIPSNGRTLRFDLAPTPEGGYVTIATDITERKRAEEQHAEKEAQLRLALDYMPGGMELVDRDWNYVFFNQQYCELHNYPDGLLKVGGSAFDETRFQVERGDFGPGDPDELMEEAHAPFQSGETNSYQRTFPDRRTLQFDVAPTPEGGYVTIATDVTERKRAEEELAEKEAQLRLALDNMPGGIKLIDSGRKYVLFNSQYSILHNYPDGLLKVGGSIIDEARFQNERGDYGPGDPGEAIEKSLVPYESGKSESYERTLPGGRTLQFYVAPTPGGGFVSIVTDITESKRAERATKPPQSRPSKKYCLN